MSDTTYDAPPPNDPPPNPVPAVTQSDRDNRDAAYTNLVDQHFPDDPGHDANSLHARIRAFLLAVRSL